MNLRASAELANLIMTHGTPEQQQALQDVRAEVRKLRDMRRRAEEVRDDPLRYGSPAAIARYILGETAQGDPDLFPGGVHERRRVLAEAEAAERAQKPAEIAFWEDT